MKYADRRTLFYFDQYFSVRLGENVYSYKRRTDHFALLRTLAALLRAGLTRKKLPLIRQDPSPWTRRHLFYVETINQYNAVSNLIEKLGRESVGVLVGGSLEDVSHVRRFPESGFKYWYPGNFHWRSIRFLLKAWLLAHPLVRKYRGRIARHHVLVNLVMFLEAVDIGEKWMVSTSPKSLTLVNDHNLVPLACILAAKRQGVTSVYIQHASVSHVFPKLLVHSAFLEGQQALDTYSQIGCYARNVQLVGIPRLDGLIGFHGDDPIPRKLIVGLCLKTFYTQEQVTQLVSALRRSPRISRILIRPHPGSPDDFIKDLEAVFPGDVSNGRTETAVEFLQRVNALVSGESTIVLEAALMKMPSIHFDDGSFFFPYDLYGFVKHDVAYCSVKHADDLTGIMETLKKERVLENFEHARYYCSTVGTPREGKSTGILVELYHQFD